MGLRNASQWVKNKFWCIRLVRNLYIRYTPKPNLELFAKPIFSCALLLRRLSFALCAAKFSLRLDDCLAKATRGRVHPSPAPLRPATHPCAEPFGKVPRLPATQKGKPPSFKPCLRDIAKTTARKISEIKLRKSSLLKLNWSHKPDGSHLGRKMNPVIVSICALESTSWAMANLRR